MKTDPISPQPPYTEEAILSAVARVAPPPRLRLSVTSLVLAKALNCLAGRCSVADLDHSLKALGITPLISHAPPAADPALPFYTIGGGIPFPYEEPLSQYGHLQHHLAGQIERAALIGRAIEMGAHAAVRKWCNELDNATPIEARIFPGPDTLILKESLNLKPEPEAHRPVEANPQVTIMEEIQ